MACGVWPETATYRPVGGSLRNVHDLLVALLLLLFSSLPLLSRVPWDEPIRREKKNAGSR